MKKINFALLGICTLLISWLLPSTMKAQEIKVTVGEKGWFKVEKLEGANISVEGMPAGFTPQIGATIAQDYQATPNSIITFKGDITGLRIVNAEGKGRADIIKVDASKAPKSLKFLSLKNLDLPAKEDVIDLSGATALESAGLIDLSKEKVYIPLLDLSKQTKLTTLYLGNPNDNDGHIKEVKLPTTNVLKDLDFSRCWINKLEFPKMPELYKLFYIAGYTPKLEITDAPKLRFVVSYRSHIKDYVFKNLPELRLLKFGGNHGTDPKGSLTVENCPKLRQIHEVKFKDGSTSKWGLWLEKSDNDVIGFKTVKLKNIGITEFGGDIADGLVAVTDLDLSNNPIKKLDFATYTTLKKVTMHAKQFETLSAEEVLATLPERKAEDNAEFNLLTSKDTDAALISKIEAELKKKGWNLKQTTAIAELLSTNAVKIYPTETSDLVKIEGSKANISYKVFALSGKLCQEGQTDAFGSAEIHLSTYAKGVYIVKLAHKTQKVVLK